MKNPMKTKGSKSSLTAANSTAAKNPNRPPAVTKSKYLAARIGVLGLFSVGTLINQAQAATLYWDSNGATAGAGSTVTGTWGVSTFWSTSSSGTTSTANTTTTSSDDLTFVAAPGGTSGNGAYTITVSGSQAAQSITFQSSGAATVSGGTIGIGSGGISIPQYAYGTTATGAVTLSASTNVVLTANQTWSHAGTSKLTVSGPVSLGGNNLIVNDSSTGSNGVTVIGGTMSGTGGFTKNGSGQATLGGANTFSGGVTLNNGKLNVNTNTAFGTGTFTWNGGTLGNNGGGRGVANYTIINGDVTADPTGNNSLSLTGTVDLGSSPHTITVNSSGANSQLIFGNQGASNSVIGSAGLTISGTGKLQIFTNNVSYTGTTTINSGATLQLGNGSTGTEGVLPASSPIVNNGTLIFARSANYTQGTNFSNSISGTGVLNAGVGGGNTLILNAINAFSGATQISKGRLRLDNGRALENSWLDTDNSVAGAATAGLAAGTGVTSLSFGGLSGSKDFATLFTTTGGNYSNITALTLNPGAAVSNTYSGVIANGATGMGLTKTGEGTQVLSGSNTYTGATAVNTGVLTINGALDNGAVSVVGGATLNGSGTIGGAVTNSGTISGGLTFNDDLTVNNGASASAAAFKGNVTNHGSITGGLALQSGKTLSGSGSVSGTTSVNGGAINGSGLTLGATTLAGDSTLSGTTTASSIAISTGTTSVSGSIDSGSSLTVSSGAKLNNTGNTRATSITVGNGATLNNNGTLVGAVSVTGVFNGTGTVDGALTIKSTGELAPGNSPGTTTVTGALTVESGAKVSMQLDGLVAGTQYDQIVVTNTGSVSLLNGSILDITFGTGLTPAIDNQFVLIDNQSDALISGTFSSLLISGSSVTLDASNSFTYNDQKFQLSYTGIAGIDSKANDLVLTVVPEPSTWVMILGGIGMLAFGQRLRKDSVG